MGGAIAVLAFVLAVLVLVFVLFLLLQLILRRFQGKHLRVMMSLGLRRRALRAVGTRQRVASFPACTNCYLVAVARLQEILFGMAGEERYLLSQHFGASRSAPHLKVRSRLRRQCSAGLRPDAASGHAHAEGALRKWTGGDVHKQGCVHQRGRCILGGVQWLGILVRHGWTGSTATFSWVWPSLRGGVLCYCILGIFTQISGWPESCSEMEIMPLTNKRIYFQPLSQVENTRGRSISQVTQNVSSTSLLNGKKARNCAGV